MERSSTIADFEYYQKSGQPTLKNETPESNNETVAANDKSTSVNNKIDEVVIDTNTTSASETLATQNLEQQIAMANAYEQNNTASVDPYVAAASQTVASSGINAGGFIMPTGEQKEVVYKIIAAEGGNRSPQEAMNIASTMINRARAGIWTGGNDIYKLATAKDQYVVYQNGDAASAVLNADSRAAVDNLFAIASMGGSTTHNYQSFRSYGSTSYGGTILDPEHKGNRYK